MEFTVFVVLCWAVWAGIKIVKALCGGLDTKRERVKNHAFEIYAESGKKNEDFSGYSHRFAKAAERERCLRVLKRLDCTEFRTFRSFCQCPQCLEWDTHYIEIGRWGKLRRGCRHCEFEWRQQ